MRMNKASRFEAFAPLDWLLLSAVALMWGSSFLLIDLGLEGFHPATVAWLRLLFGAATLACIPAARRSIPGSEWPWVALLGIVWMALPFLLFTIAQQWITSSLAGMINGAAPLFTAAIAAVWYRKTPRNWQLAGLVFGFGGILAIYWPTLGEASATAFGAGLILLATFMYGVAFNLADPLENRNGALPVIWRAQLVALVLVSPFGLYGLGHSSPEWQDVAATAALGIFCTGLAFAAFTTLVGRVGALRGSVTVYFIPVVAIILGVVIRNESVAFLSVCGTALVLLGAYFTSRRQTDTQ